VRRPGPRKALARRALIVLALAMSLVLVGRAHVFQAIGIHIACAHPGATQQVDNDSHDGSDGGDHGCPASCHRCACGQMPLVPPAEAVQPVRVLCFLELPTPTVRHLSSDGERHRIDRPPRTDRGRAG